MRIALFSTMAPFVNGGARHIVDWLSVALKKEGHEVEIVYLPEYDAPDLLFQQMMAFRWVDLSSADRVICFRPQSHLISHPNKVVWFIHHIRSFYDLWDSEYRHFPEDMYHKGIRKALFAADNAALAEAKHIYTNSRVVSDRLIKYNNIDSEVLYPPVIDSERFHCRSFNDEIVYVSRLEHHKRQHLLVEAMKHTTTPVRLRLCGSSYSSAYPDHLRGIIQADGVADRVILEDRWISEEEKVEILADCLAAAYVPVDEDSYGYPTLEASHASKAILTTSDSGGVLEFVKEGVNGLIADPDPRAVAVAMDRLYREREQVRLMGIEANKRLAELGISWDHVVKRLLA
ncbi:glycosyltransferase family 4 protein [Dyella acidiphila]|uniref:Glycosyltransferase family 4 protein n=1 Tax=Dyella acidiphila TaxID=2775866 RepID=A0ABR9G582_9GAMM|nr:glycosyltransferase family 4 protein [Dyella acidiphila]MBE1159190.1 glycosyltransferase family 4 protein [Dyella acidiphila]